MNVTFVRYWCHSVYITDVSRGLQVRMRRWVNLCWVQAQVLRMLEMGNARKPGNMQLNCTSENHFTSIPPVSP